MKGVVAGVSSMAVGASVEIWKLPRLVTGVAVTIPLVVSPTYGLPVAAGVPGVLATVGVSTSRVPKESPEVGIRVTVCVTLPG